MAIGAVIIKHKLCLSDRETVAQIQENPYLQYFVGWPGYQMAAPFAPSLLVEIRKRMGQSVFEVFHGAIIDAVDQAKAKDKPARQSRPENDDPRMTTLMISRPPRRRPGQEIPLRNQSRRCAHRIVSISQPYVRPIIRGKLDKSVERRLRVF